ncbi:MAG: hypothetical protein DDT42_01426 [candidate division WS2 bacterium]|uniref:O-antigen ligase-related domain-containing protein n=1 Tax=Psychracetigena formicireducens TaxID=2986056 RepID=A0A9E2BM73_PSYF1|nr:hypothetical protein [Candidatus Psychracetigena formicireducens]
MSKPKMALMSILKNIILALQPFFAVLIYSSILLGTPPLWLSWLIVLVPLLVRYKTTGQLGRKTPFDLPILIFIIGIITGLIVSSNRTISLQAFHTFLASLFVFYSIVSNYKYKKGYWISLGGVIVICFLSVTIYTFTDGGGRVVEFNRWLWDLANSQPDLNLRNYLGHNYVLTINWTGSALAIGLPLLLALALYKGLIYIRIVSAVLFLALFTLHLLNASAVGWISSIFGLTFVLTFWKPWFFSIILVLIGIGGYFSSFLWHQTTWFSQLFPVGSLIARIDFWNKTINLLKDHPFSGLGLGMWFKLFNSQYNTGVISPHNTYLQLYSDTGLIGFAGLLLGLVIFIKLLRYVLKTDQKPYWFGALMGFYGGFISAIINGLLEVTTSQTLTQSGNPSFTYIYLPYLWVWLGFMVVAYLRLTTNPTVIQIVPQ